VQYRPQQTRFTFGRFYVCANFGENLSRNATVRVLADGHTLIDRCKLILAILVGQSLLPKILGQTDPIGAKSPILRLLFYAKIWQILQNDEISIYFRS